MNATKGMILVFALAATPAWAWVNSPRCNLDAMNNTVDSDYRANWAVTKKTQLNDVTYLTLAAANEITANPSFHLYPIYTTIEGYNFRGPGPNIGTWAGHYPTGGYHQGQGPLAAPWLLAGAEGQVSGVAIENVPANYKPSSEVFNEWVCQPGCYMPDQTIRFEKEGFVSIASAVKNGTTDVVTLAPGATLDRLAFQRNEVLSYTFDIQDSWQEILIFKARSGGELKVTTEHPIVAKDGTIKRASDFSVGEFLVREDGTFDRIMSIEKTQWFGTVYNLRPETTDLASNVIVAQGYLNGSQRYQHEYVNELNRVILRETIPDDVIP